MLLERSSQVFLVCEPKDLSLLILVQTEFLSQVLLLVVLDLTETEDLSEEYINRGDDISCSLGRLRAELAYACDQVLSELVVELDDLDASLLE